MRQRTNNPGLVLKSRVYEVTVPHGEGQELKALAEFKADGAITIRKPTTGYGGNANYQFTDSKSEIVRAVGRMLIMVADFADGDVAE